MTDVDTETGMVVTVKFADVDPAATVTLAGTVVEGSLLVNVTRALLDGAGPFSVTVPVEEAPPVTVDGLKETAESASGITLRIVFAVTP